jgi:abortive infection bacteriophage resistance protein
LSWAEQVALLLKRGLVVSDEAECAKFLAATNYYRFSGPCAVDAPCVPQWLDVSTIFN